MYVCMHACMHACMVYIILSILCNSVNDCKKVDGQKIGGMACMTHWASGPLHRSPSLLEPIPGDLKREVDFAWKSEI